LVRFLRARWKRSRPGARRGSALNVEQSHLGNIGTQTVEVSKVREHGGHRSANPEANGLREIEAQACWQTWASRFRAGLR